MIKAIEKTTTKTMKNKAKTGLQHWEVNLQKDFSVIIFLGKKNIRKRERWLLPMSGEVLRCTDEVYHRQEHLHEYSVNTKKILCLAIWRCQFSFEDICAWHERTMVFSDNLHTHKTEPKYNFLPLHQLYMHWLWVKTPSFIYGLAPITKKNWANFP